MKLSVIIGGRLAGEVDIGRDLPAFRYDPDYRRTSSVPLSLVAPLPVGGAEGDRLRNWLLGALPDDPEVLDALCVDHGVARHDPIGLLGGPMGADCAGAVQFCPPEQTENLLFDPGHAEPIDDAGIADWLDRMEIDPARRAYRTDGADSGFSIGGMQPKAALRHTADDGWAVPHGSLPTTHLIKASRSRRWPHEALIEHLTMRTAAGCGIPASRTRIAQFADKEVIIVERYDRTDNGTIRVHQEDMCQALGIAPNLKYQRNGGPGPEDVADALRAADPEIADANIGRLLDILLFQWVAASTDGHAKNLSVIHPGDGSVHLAPLYDACCWLPYRKGRFEKKTQMAMKIGTDYSLKTADSADALHRTAERLGIDTSTVARRAAHIANALPDALNNAINTLTSSAPDCAEVVALSQELPDRAARCAEIAETAARAPADLTRTPDGQKVPRYTRG